MAKITLTDAEVEELRQLLADLYFPAMAHGPVPMQQSYWPRIVEQCRQWREKLAPSDEEIERWANATYERATKRFQEET